MDISFRNGLAYEGSNGFEALIDGKIAGSFDIRTNTHLIDSIGHIGYAVREEFRGRGIGTLICEEAIRRARVRFAISDVIICCASDNTPSRRIIEKCGGRFIGEKKCCSGAHDLMRFVVEG